MKARLNISGPQQRFLKNPKLTIRLCRGFFLLSFNNDLVTKSCISGKVKAFSVGQLLEQPLASVFGCQEWPSRAAVGSDPTWSRNGITPGVSGSLKSPPCCESGLYREGGGENDSRTPVNPCSSVLRFDVN